MKNSELAKHFNRLADLAKAAGDSGFKANAYSKAASNIEQYGEPVWELDDPTVIDGVGKGISEKIHELRTQGFISKMKKYEAKVPYHELLFIHGIGPVKAKYLFENHKITKISELQIAVETGIVKDSRIEVGLKAYNLTGNERLPLLMAENIILPILVALGYEFPKAKIQVCGSLRRRKETIGDGDILVAANKKSQRKILSFFEDQLDEVLASGNTKVSGIKNGMQIDLRVVEPKHFGAALLYFTGSQQFNIELRNIAIRQGMTLNEYRIQKGKKSFFFETEEEVFDYLGLNYVRPEDREDTSKLHEKK